MPDYWIRHKSPAVTDEFCRIVDKGLDDLVEKCLKFNFESFTDFTKERIRLPIKLKGLGLRNSTERRYSHYMGAIMSSIITIVGRKCSDGLKLKGKVNEDLLKDWLGENPFDGTKAPWEILYTKGDESAIGKGVRMSWKHLCDMLRSIKGDDVDEEERRILHGDEDYAGFQKDEDNLTVFEGSLTRRITEIIERARYESLSKKIKSGQVTGSTTAFERLSFYHSDTFSTQFLQALPTKIGITPNDVFSVGIHNLLGQPCPLLQCFKNKPHYIGRKGKVVDEYGLNVSNAMLVGGDYFRNHSYLQNLFCDMLRKAKLYHVKEPHNIFATKLDEVTLQNYINADEKDKIRSDIIAYNMPKKVKGFGEDKQHEILEVKTKRVESNFSQYCHLKPNKKAVEKRDQQIRTEYKRKARKLDENYAREEGATPFQEALQSFGGGGIRPLVIGAYGEVNDETYLLLKDCAAIAAQNPDVANMSPTTTSQHGSNNLYQILLRQFRQALGCMATRLNAELIIRRIHYIRPTKEAAIQVASHGLPKGQFWEHSPSWFNCQENEDAYNAFYVYGRNFQSSFEENYEEN